MEIDAKILFFLFFFWNLQKQRKFLFMFEVCSAFGIEY